VSWIPNAVSISRIGFASLTFWYGKSGKWDLAFSFLLIALLTDWLDGWLAIRLEVKSDLGAMLEDPCDLSLSVGCLAGLLFAGVISWTTVIIIVVVCGLLSAGLVLSQPGKRFFRFSSGMSAFTYLAVVLGCTWIYAVQTLGRTTAVKLVPLAMVIGILAAYEKRHRIMEWLTW